MIWGEHVSSQLTGQLTCRIDVAADEVVPKLFKKTTLKGGIDTSVFQTTQVSPLTNISRLSN